MNQYQTFQSILIPTPHKITLLMSTHFWMRGRPELMGVNHYAGQVVNLKKIRSTRESHLSLMEFMIQVMKEKMMKAQEKTRDKELSLRRN